jgi:protein associated with RNAse G/E
MAGVQEVTVISRSYDGAVRKTWKAQMVFERPPFIELFGMFDRDVRHPNLGLIQKGTRSYEYYWLDRWYNVFRFHEPDDTFRNYYCNVGLPPKFGNGVLDYVDLDIDVVVTDTGDVHVLDRDDFDRNATKFGLSPEIRNQTESALEQLLSLIRLRKFPFEIA